MFDFKRYDKDLVKFLTPKRFEHVKRVRKKALELAKIYNAPTDIIEVGAYLHDIAKYFDDEKAYSLIESKYLYIFDDGFKINEILHGFAGAAFIKKNYNITNELILDSIRYHTIGREKMTIVDKIIYLADAIEDGRDYPFVNDIRKLALSDLDSAILLEINTKLNHLINKGSLIHPNTIKMRNTLLRKGKDDK